MTVPADRTPDARPPSRPAVRHSRRVPRPPRADDVPTAPRR